MLSVPAFAELTDDGKVVQDRITLNCKGEQGALNFKLNRSTSVAVFLNKEAMARAELPVSEPIAALISDNEIKITYRWYFTAEYMLTFDKVVGALKAGDTVAMLLDGDDNDGFMFNNVRFNCTVK